MDFYAFLEEEDEPVSVPDPPKKKNICIIQ